LSYLALQFIREPWIVYWIALFMSFVSLGLRLYFLSHLTKFSILSYVKFVLTKAFLVSFISVFLCWLFMSIFETQSQIVLFLSSLIVTIVIVLINIILFGLSSAERQFIQNKIKGYLK